MTYYAAIEEKAITDEVRRVQPVDGERHHVIEGHRRT